ncbi:twin-arginine translocation signal domain-containing protein [Simkania sp.]
MSRRDFMKGCTSSVPL